MASLPTFSRHLSRLFRRKAAAFHKQFPGPSACHLKTSAMVLTTSEPESFYVLQQDTPVCQLQCDRAWKGLSANEKLYTHHMARAGWAGAIILHHQTSPEAAPIGVLLYDLFDVKPLSELRQTSMQQCAFTEEDWRALLIYKAGFWSNNANYKSFGDTKFIPGLSMGTTAYLSANVTPEDAKLANGFMSHRGLEAWNTRLFKTVENGKTHLEIRLASIQHGDVHPPEEYEGCMVRVTRGDYSGLLQHVTNHLHLSIPHANNDQQREMLKKYIEYFDTGNLKAHMDGSRHWIKDIAPPVESYIGFIENYTDPAGVRASFEGFVAAVDRETSKKFSALVKNAEVFLRRLPWAKSGYEKDTFLQPDFTSLDVIGFGSNGVPSGINIPNYDEIRQMEGFKNVSLGNVVSAIPDMPTTFVSADDDRLIKKHFKTAFEVQVGLHELLGHGSGKLFVRRADGTFNFDRDTQKDLLTGESIKSWYEEGETYNGHFGQMGSAYEECRAEAVGYYLCTCPDVLKVFNLEGEEGQTIAYVNWLSEMRAGLVALEMFDAGRGLWGQAHSWARYVLLRVCMVAGQGFVRIEEKVGSDGKPDLLLTVDKSKIESVGRPAVAEFLKQLQAYKSVGDGEGGAKLFNEHTPAGDDYWLRVRDIVIQRRQPRKILVQPNTFLDSSKDTPSVQLTEYPATMEGLVESVMQRYKQPEDWRETSMQIWAQNKHHFGLSEVTLL